MRTASSIVCRCQAELFGSEEAALATARLPLNQAYFCENCYDIRCPACIVWEISSSFCPHCLFEVPGTSVHTQKSRCARSCFECPICFHVLSVVGSDPEHQSALTSPEASQGIAPFYLSCTCCRWDSKRLGLVADKPSDISARYAAMEQSSWDVQEFQSVMAHVADEIQANMQSRSLRKSRQPIEPLEPYIPTMSRPLSKHASRLSNQKDLVLNDPSHASTLAQRWAMPGDQPYNIHALRPQRVQLVSKLSKRCPTCRHILVRPDLQTSSNAFKIKLLAHHHLPSCMASYASSGLVTITFSNPLMDAMDVSLAGAAELSMSQIQIPPLTDAFEWDDEGLLDEALDAFTHGPRVHRNQVSISARASGEWLGLRITWQVAGSSKAHTFWSWIPLGSL